MHLYTQQRNAWAEKLDFTVPETTEPFARTHIDGKMFVVETQNAQCLFQVMHFPSEEKRLEFMKKNDVVIRRVDDSNWIVFIGSVYRVNVGIADEKAIGDYFFSTINGAVEWLRKEGTC